MIQKFILDHIESQLKDCTDEQKTTFKQVVEGVLGGDIDQFTNQASSMCNMVGDRGGVGMVKGPTKK